jgi:hypothetical protein
VFLAFWEGAVQILSSAGAGRGHCANRLNARNFVSIQTEEGLATR